MTDDSMFKYHRQMLEAEETLREIASQAQALEEEAAAIPDYSPPSLRTLVLMILDLDDRLKALEAKP